jgi:O-acetyl-ADP-ribose deacetylase (regulator of RNase III)
MAQTVFEENHGARRFQVVLNDLLAEPVDCIVNAANGGLSHGGGIAAIIAEAAGERMEAACERVIAKVGRVPTGKAAITTAGDLPFKAIVHAVGPRQGEGNEENLLVSALKFSFSISAKQGYGSISFPAVSSGIFGVPADACARAYRRAVQEYWQEHPDSSLTLIRLCLIEGPVLDEVRRQYPA